MHSSSSPFFSESSPHAHVAHEYDDKEEELLLQRIMNEEQDDENTLQVLLISNAAAATALLLLEIQSFSDSSPSSVHQRRPNRKRGREEHARKLLFDYFHSDPDRGTYSPEQFRCRYRMCRPLFETILADLVEHNPFFTQSRDCLNVRGFTGTQKLCVALKMIATGSTADSLDEHYRMSARVVRDCLTQFCSSIVGLYEARYLSPPTAEEMKQVLIENSARGFPGMLGSLDCMHWEWRNCPSAWKGAYTGRSGTPSVILEAVADRNYRISHYFFGMAGSFNDINVLNNSTLFDDLRNGSTPSVQFDINNRSYSQGYYLTDGIYPSWPVFVKPFSNPLTEPEKYFTVKQAELRKDIECTFGILQARFHILARPSRLTSIASMSLVMKTCVILHNMIICDEMPRKILQHSKDFIDPNISPFSLHHDRNSRLDDTLYRSSRNTNFHAELRKDLVQHLWNLQN